VGRRAVGMVAGGHPDTAAAGAEVMELGGNAADAAVAASFAAMVAEASLTGMGAGGFALVREPGSAPHLLDFFVAAPGKGRTPGDRENRSHLVAFYVPFRATTQRFNIGPSSCAVPGVVPGLLTLHRRYGRVPLAAVLEPAIRLTRDGALLVPQQEYLHDILAGILHDPPEMQRIFAPEGQLLRAGERLRIPELADTLEVLAREGEAAFHSGALAERIADFMEESGGLITREDLETYTVIDRRPVEVSYRGQRIWTNPPPSSGGTLIAYTLKTLSDRHLAELDPSAGTLALVEAFAQTDRARAGGFDQAVRDPGFAEKFLGNTTHISAIDADGLAVSVTSSCGSGSGVVVPGTGIIMNNMMGEEDLNPGGHFSLAPGERLTSMMAPTLAEVSAGSGLPRSAEGAGGPEMILALGSAGSERLRSAIVQTLSNVLDRSMGLQQAVEAPRVHLTGNTVQIEPGVPDSAVQALVNAGYEVNRWPECDLYFGGVQAAAFWPSPSGRFDGGGDPRRGGSTSLAVTIS